MGSSSSVRSLLLPLALLLQPFGSPAQPRFRMSPAEKLDVRPAEQVRLQCEALSASNTGCSWLRQAPGALTPTFLLYISGGTSSVKLADGLDAARFGGERLSPSTYRLTVRDFGAQDQGYYFCVVTRNALMYFSPFVAVFLPVKATTPAPKPKTTSLLTTTSSPIRNSANSGKCKPITSSQAKKGLDFSCDLYIWMPLTGVCVVLLLALIIAITICQNESAGVHGPSSDQEESLAHQRDLSNEAGGYGAATSMTVTTYKAVT